MRVLAVLLALGAGPAQAGVLKVAELGVPQIRELNKDHTAVILPGGILEEHGPYLPSYSDGYWNERIAADVAEAIGARQGWNALVFPPIPLGTGGANEIGAKYSYPGSYTVRSSTLRAIFMDLASELGDQGFKWIFVVHGHGSPNHNQALDEAGAFFHDAYGGRMVHLMGLKEVADCCDAGRRSATRAALREDGFTVHAGAGEHSDVMFLRPDLVPGTIKLAQTFAGSSFADLVTKARRPDWPGYFGAPRLASAERGRLQYEQESAFIKGFALKVLDGYDPGAGERLADEMLKDPAIAKVIEGARAREAEQEARQQQWLKSRGKP
ncbi:MAG TPA: creatininase family protein [Vicinamibacteria bacterium]|nr:creatininase family protein [Vicinamibacteria bacterium]